MQGNGFVANKYKNKDSRWSKMLAMVLLCELGMMSYSGRGRIKAPCGL